MLRLEERISEVLIVCAEGCVCMCVMWFLILLMVVFSSYFAAVSLVRVFNKSKNRVYAVTFAPAHTRFTRALKNTIYIWYMAWWKFIPQPLATQQTQSRARGHRKCDPRRRRVVDGARMRANADGLVECARTLQGRRV